jgi:hypothetical protein
MPFGFSCALCAWGDPRLGSRAGAGRYLGPVESPAVVPDISMNVTNFAIVPNFVTHVPVTVYGNVIL